MQEKLKDENTLVNCLIHVDVFGEGNKREYNNISIEKNISGGTITVTVIESNKTVFKAESKRG